MSGRDGVLLSIFLGLLTPYWATAVRPDCDKLFPGGFKGGQDTWQWGPSVERRISFWACTYEYCCTSYPGSTHKYGQFSMSYLGDGRDDDWCGLFCAEPTKVTEYNAGRHVTYHFGPSTCTNSTFQGHNLTQAQMNIACGTTSFYLEDVSVVGSLLNVSARAPCGPDPPALSPVSRNCEQYSHAVPTAIWSGFLNSTIGEGQPYFDFGVNLCTDGHLLPTCPRGFFNAVDTKNRRQISMTNFDGVERITNGFRYHYSNDIGAAAVITVVQNAESECIGLQIPPLEGVSTSFGSNGMELFKMKFQCL